MERNHSWVKLTVAGIASALLLSNCVTTYDRYGRPVQTVDPAAAAIGAVAIGAVAYAAGKDDRHHHSSHHRYGHHGHYRGHGYRGCR